MKEGVAANAPAFRLDHAHARATPGPGPRSPPCTPRVPIVLGTDANQAPGVPADVPFGEGAHRELELLVDAGLAPVEALQAATGAAADRFGLPDGGRIAPGLRADLLLVEGDATADTRATRAVRSVRLAGRAGG